MSTTITGANWDTPLDEDAFLAELEKTLPAHLIPGLHRYVTQCVPTAGFLRSVLENDLAGAVGRCAAEIRESQPTILHDLVFVLYNHAPALCWGSKEAVEAWLRRAQ